SPSCWPRAIRACEPFHKLAKKPFDAPLAARQINGLPPGRSLPRPFQTPAARKESPIVAIWSSRLTRRRRLGIMLVREILADKGRAVHSCAPGDTLADVADLLVGHNIGS